MLCNSYITTLNNVKLLYVCNLELKQFLVKFFIFRFKTFSLRMFIKRIFKDKLRRPCIYMLCNITINNQ